MLKDALDRRSRRTAASPRRRRVILRLDERTCSAAQRRYAGDRQSAGSGDVAQPCPTFELWTLTVAASASSNPIAAANSPPFSKPTSTKRHRRRSPQRVGDRGRIDLLARVRPGAEMRWIVPVIGQWPRQDVCRITTRYMSFVARSALHTPARDEAMWGFEWCCQRGLNSRPLPYQGSALPLSYGSDGVETRDETIGAAETVGGLLP